MTEVLNAAQLTLLRRVVAAGYVRIVTAEEKTTLEELLQENSSSEINSPKLDGGNFEKTRVSLEWATEQKRIVNEAYPPHSLATATI